MTADPEAVTRALAERMPFDVVDQALPYYQRLDPETALTILCEWVEEWDYHGDEHNYCHFRAPLVVFLTHVAAVLASLPDDRLAEAWDRGWSAARQVDRATPKSGDNPYRAALSGGDAT